MYCCHSHSMFCNRFGKTHSQTSLIGCNFISFHFYIWTPLWNSISMGRMITTISIYWPFKELFSFFPPINAVNCVFQRQIRGGKYLGDKERMVWSPMWLNVLQTIVWLPFKSHAQSSFDKSVLLSNPHSKMVGFCFGLAIPTLVWYTTLVFCSHVMWMTPSLARKK